MDLDLIEEKFELVNSSKGVSKFWRIIAIRSQNWKLGRLQLPHPINTELEVISTTSSSNSSVFFLLEHFLTTLF